MDNQPKGQPTLYDLFEARSLQSCKGGRAPPVEFEALAPPPLLLPGERLDHYHALRQAIFADLAPRSAIEWLLAIDIAELSWEIQRYRLLRHRLLATYRQQAIEAALRRIDMVGIAPEFEDEADHYPCARLADQRRSFWP